MPKITYLSLGWGIQSWTIAAMVALGELPMIDLAIHADTTHEAQGTYAHAKKWTPWLIDHGLRVETVRSRDTDAVTNPTNNGVFIPATTVQRTNGSLGKLSRQCTERWKIRPIRTQLRELLGGRTRPGDVLAWLGISVEEWHRMKSSDAKYIVNHYPLVDMRMSRTDCITWLESQKLDVPPKSTCVFCPYHSPQSWRTLKANNGPDWQHALEVDNAIRERRPDHRLFVHSRGMPLEQAVKIPQDYGAEQMEMEIPCDAGVCFV